MINNPFGLPEGAADRLAREEFERTERYRSMAGGGAVAEAIREATKYQNLIRDPRRRASATVGL